MDSTGNNIKLNIANLKLILKSKRQLADDLNERKGSAVAKAAELVNLGDPNMLWAWMQPLMSSIDSEDEAKEFAKLLLVIYRLHKQGEAAQSEANAVGMLLDKKGPLSLASVNFDDLELTEEDK